MKPDESLDAFRDFLGGPGADLEKVSPASGLSAMLRFFRETRAEDCDAAEGDVLLYQWGTYDWGKGEHFEINITRQFRPVSGNDEIAQLSLTFMFPPDAELRSVGQGDRWCKKREELGAFERFVVSSLPHCAAGSRETSRVELKYEYV